MNFNLGNSTTKGGKFFYFEVEVGPNPMSFEAYMKKIFAGVGLRTDAAIKAFDRFMGQAYFQWLVNKSRNTPDIAKAVTNPQGKIIKITVQVFPGIVEKLKRFGIDLLTNSKGKTMFKGYAPSFTGNVKKYQDFKPVPDTPVSQWTTVQKLDAVIRRAALLLPEDVGKELLALIEPLALAIMAAVVIVWAVSHFFGIGEIADVVLIIVGVVSLGPIAWKAGEHLINFAVGTVGAKTDEDLDEAAKHLSEAVALIGVQVVVALLLKKAPKVFNEPKVLMNQPKPSVPLTMKTVGEPPVTSGKIFYEPKLSVTEHPFGGTDVGGSTNKWGDINIFRGKKSLPKDVEIAKFHEKFHSLLAPKLQAFPWLRQARTVLKTNSYLKSYLLRYLEEAMAETIAQVRGSGWQFFFEGIKFPIGNEGYVTIAKMGVEAQGILLGPINAGGMIFRVYYSYSEDW